MKGLIIAEKRTQAARILLESMGQNEKEKQRLRIRKNAEASEQTGTYLNPRVPFPRETGTYQKKKRN